jgi:hypothetical protein
MPKLKPRTPDTGFREPTPREMLELVLCGFSPYAGTCNTGSPDWFPTWEAAWADWRASRARRLAAAAREGDVPAAWLVWGDR